MQGVTYRASRTYDGKQPDLHCGSPSISNSGRVAFDCLAGNMVPNDTNGAMDVFIADYNGAHITRVSTGSNGEQATNGNSGRPSISANGLAVAFESYADGLAPGDIGTFGNKAPDVFVKVLTNNHLHYASRGSNGELGGKSSLHPWLSADGSVVVFESEATNLITDLMEHATTANQPMTKDVFLHDIAKGTTTRVSNGKLGAAVYGVNPSVDATGKFVVYESGNHMLLWERSSRTGQLVSVRGAEKGNNSDYQGAIAPPRR